jgi:hypothetical protein
MSAVYRLAGPPGPASRWMIEEFKQRGEPSGHHGLDFAA